MGGLQSIEIQMGANQYNRWNRQAVDGGGRGGRRFGGLLKVLMKSSVYGIQSRVHCLQKRSFTAIDCLIRVIGKWRKRTTRMRRRNSLSAAGEQQYEV